MLHPAPRDLLAAASSRQRLPLTTDYTPAVAESQSESQLRHPDLAFAADPGSSRVFAGTTLLFQKENEFKNSKVANKKKIYFLSQLPISLTDRRCGAVRCGG